MGRVLIDHYDSSTVVAGGTTVWTSPEIPSGQTWHVDRFGGAALESSLIALQIRVSENPNVWETLRAVASPGSSEFVINRDYKGDGVIRFRVVRQNKGGSQVVAYWVEGYKTS